MRCSSLAPGTGRSPGLFGQVGRVCYRRRWLSRDKRAGVPPTGLLQAVDLRLGC
jgi:hypothetical protein